MSGLTLDERCCDNEGGGSSLGWALQAVGELEGCVRWADGSGAGEGAAGGAGVGCAVPANWVVADRAETGRSR